MTTRSLDESVSSGVKGGVVAIDAFINTIVSLLCMCLCGGKNFQQNRSVSFTSKNRNCNGIKLPIYNTHNLLAE